MTDKSVTVKIDEDLVRRANRLHSRAARYYRLSQLGAPELILEFERQLIFQALMALPALPEMIALRERTEDDLREEEQKFLKEHGYYKDEEEALEKLTKASKDMGEEP